MNIANLLVAWNWERMLVDAVAIIGAVILSLPLAFIYLRTKPTHEFDSDVLFTLVFLAATIAGILVVVEGSVPRALSLAGVVSAVRFKSSLKDSNDAVYILGAITVGLAAGSHELDVGVVISALLSLTLVLLWKVRLDTVDNALLPTEDAWPHGHHHRRQEATPHQPETARLEGNGAVRAPRTASGHLPVARLGYFVLETAHVERTRLLAEVFFERETKRWRLEAATRDDTRNGHRSKDDGGTATLLYVVRFRKSSRPEAIVERLKAVGLSSSFSVRLEVENELLDLAKCNDGENLKRAQFGRSVRGAVRPD